MQRIAAIGSLVMLWLSSMGYTQVELPLSFEVASVKPSRPDARGNSMEFSKGGDRFSATNVPFGGLVLIAYNITVRQLSGPPEFLSQRYDVAAKAAHPVGSQEMLRMLRALLAERFKLVLRRETKDAPVYALTIGKGGLKLHASNLPADWTEVPGRPRSPRAPSKDADT